MALNFGHNDLEENHIHDVKPLIALPYYQVFTTNFLFKYTDGINVGVWRYPAKEGSHIPRRDMIVNGWVEEKNSQLELYAHTFDSDDNITNLTMRYELMCFMLDGSVEFKLIEEFDIMPYKITPGVVDSMNHFIFTNKKYFISDLQPNFNNMFRMSIRTKNVSSSQTGLNNESILETLLIHNQMMKQVNDVILQVL